jgi:hypothetical protein
MSATHFAAFFIIGIAAMAQATTSELRNVMHMADKEIEHSQMGRKLTQTGTLDSIIKSLPTTIAGNNPPTELPIPLDLSAAAPLLHTLLAPTPGPAPSLLRSIEDKHNSVPPLVASTFGSRRLRSESLAGLISTTPTTTASDNPPSKIPVTVFAAESLPSLAQTPTPAPAPGPSSMLPTLENDRRRLSETLSALIKSAPATTAGNNPPTEVPVVNVFAAAYESPVTAPADLSVPAPAPGPGPSTAAGLPTIEGSTRKLLQA